METPVSRWAASAPESITFPLLSVGLVLGLFPLLLSYSPSLLAVLILPWILVTTQLYAAIPAVIAEQSGVRASIVRSAHLTRGRRWRIFAILVLLGLTKMAATSLLSSVLSDDQPTLAIAGHLLLDLFIEVYAAVVAAVSYVALVRSYPPA